MDRTFRQYVNDERSMLKREYPDASAEDIADCRPEDQLREQHFEACYSAARNGVIMRRQVLDSLTPRGRYRIFHDFPDYLRQWNSANPSAWYVAPEARA